MYGQPLGRHLRAVGQARIDHPPAHHPLQPAKRKQHHAAPDQARGDRTLPEEQHERDGERHSHEPPQQPVAPFPPVDELEPTERHALVHDPVLGNLFVVIELRLPLGRVQGRDRAGQRLPLGDRQARVGQPCGAADHHHGEHHGRHDEQPDRDGTGAALPEERSHALPGSAEGTEHSRNALSRPRPPSPGGWAKGRPRSKRQAISEQHI